MAQEKYRRRSIAEEFDTSLMYDDIEKIREREEEEEKDQNGKIGSAGLMALIAGAGLLVTGLIGGSTGLAEFLTIALPTIGFGALGYGMFKTLRQVFRQKELNFPALNVYRKTRPAPAGQTREREKEKETTRATRESTFERAQDQTYGRNQARRVRTYRRTEKKTLRRSRTNRVFSGVAGGVAEYLGISAALIRFAFIAAIFLGMAMPIFIYLLFSIVLPANYDDYEDNRSRPRPTPPSGSFPG
ncbi:MAG: PspC domain-containing protein [Bacteroidota bacterium]